MKTDTYKNGRVKIESEIPFLRIENVNIIDALDEHDEAWLIACIEEKDAILAIDSISTDTNFKIKYYLEEEEVLLFNGVVVSFKISFINGQYKIELQLKSYTYLLDIEKKSRSFQSNYSFYSIFNKIIKEDHGGLVIQNVEKEKKQLYPYVQYEETDWEFIKRLATDLHTVLITDMGKEKPQIHIGIPEKNIFEISTFEYKLYNNFGEYIKKKSNDKSIQELDFLEYEFISNKNYNICDRIQYEHSVFLVVVKEAYWENETLNFKYRLRKEKGIKPTQIVNTKIIGASIDGVVLDVQGDKVKVHLSIDEEQNKENAYWFPMSTPYSNQGSGGWYSMPANGDSVKVCFPNTKTKNAYIIAVKRTDGDTNEKTGDPTIRYFETSDGKELKVSCDELSISAKKGISITMTNDGGIDINSIDEILINSDKSIVLSGSDVELSASDHIDLVTRYSNIIVDETVHLKAIEGVWSNGQPAK